MTGKAWRLGSVRALALACAGLMLGAPAGAAQKTVLEEVLDILLEENRISEKKYQELMERHQQEQQAAAATPAVAAPPVSARAEEDPEGWTAKWKNGLRVERNDGYHKIKIGGRIMNDWAAIHEGSGLVNRGHNSNWITGTEFRRARLFVSGTLFDRMIFKAQYDFADGSPEFKDVFVGMEELGPVDRLRIGHFKTPFGLEQLTSSKYITFMERSLPDVFDPARDTGAAVNSALLDDRMTVAVGGFRLTDDFGSGFGNEDNYNIALRLTGLPCYDDDGAQLLHLGFGYVHEFREHSTVSLDQRPEMHMADNLLDTGDIVGVNSGDVFGTEIAWVHGPFSIQTEFKGMLMQRNAGQPDLWFWGTYAEASYWLTGEHRNYKRSSADFDRVTPIHSFDPAEGHWGAFQVAARYSYLDLDDEDINGGREDDMTLGINWHLYSNARVMLNYVWGRVRSQGDVNGVQTRFQIDF